MGFLRTAVKLFVICLLAKLVHAEDGFGPIYFPTIEKAMDDADWVGRFAVQNNTLMLKKMFKGQLPEHWTGGQKDQEAMYPGHWATAYEHKNIDLFVFAMAKEHRLHHRKHSLYFVVKGNVSSNTLNVASENFTVAVDIQGRPIIDSALISAVLEFYADKECLHDSRKFGVPRRHVVFEESNPYALLGFITGGPRKRDQFRDQIRMLPKTHALKAYGSILQPIFYAEDRFIPPLLKKLNEGNMDQRASAARCLRHYKTHEVNEALKFALKDPSHAAMKGKARGEPYSSDGLWYPVRQEAYESLVHLGDEYSSTRMAAGTVKVGEHYSGVLYGFPTLDVHDLEVNWGLEPVEIPGYEPAPILDSRTVSTLASNAPSSNAIPAQNHESILETNGSKRPIFWTVIASFCSLVVGVLIGRQLATSKSQKSERTEGP